MKYSKNTYMKALAALAALRTTLSEKEQHTVDFVAEAITEKADRDTRPATRADRFRSMSDEEMATKIVEFAINSGWITPGNTEKQLLIRTVWNRLRQPCEEATT